jgi:catechol 2,3-dioxygenase-like lactoylglutathione lyase family enzyme
MKVAPEKAKMILFAYTVSDYEKTATFYKQALGVEFPSGTFAVKRLDIATGNLSEGDAKVELLQMDRWRGAESGYAFGHIGFQVKEIGAMVAHLKDLGYEPSEILFPFEGNDKVKICYFRGPNDEKLELVQMDE